MNPRIHPRIATVLEVSEICAKVAELGIKAAHHKLRPRRKASYVTRRPGAETPQWNVCVMLLKEELRPLGSKVRLARYLGIPKQRLNDFLTGHSRLPDAEITLSMLNWLSAKRAGRDLSL
jgi:hypothetical protein